MAALAAGMSSPWSVKSALHFGVVSLEGTGFGLTGCACYYPGFPPSDFG